MPTELSIGLLFLLRTIGSWIRNPSYTTFHERKCERHLGLQSLRSTELIGATALLMMRKRHTTSARRKDRRRTREATRRMWTVRQEKRREWRGPGSDGGVDGALDGLVFEQRTKYVGWRRLVLIPVTRKENGTWERSAVGSQTASRGRGSGLVLPYCSCVRLLIAQLPR